MFEATARGGTAPHTRGCRCAAPPGRTAVMGRISSEFWERETTEGKKSQLTTEVVVESIEFHGPPTQRPQPTASVQAASAGRGAKAA
jgi:single-stranded DNA-binding protein